MWISINDSRKFGGLIPDASVCRIRRINFGRRSSRHTSVAPQLFCILPFLATRRLHVGHHCCWCIIASKDTKWRKWFFAWAAYSTKFILNQLEVHKLPNLQATFPRGIGRSHATFTAIARWQPWMTRPSWPLLICPVIGFFLRIWWNPLIGFRCT